MIGHSQIELTLIELSDNKKKQQQLSAFISITLDTINTSIELLLATRTEIWLNHQVDK